MVDSPPEANSTNAEDMEDNPIDDTVDETAEESGDKSDEEEEDDNNDIDDDDASEEEEIEAASDDEVADGDEEEEGDAPNNEPSLAADGVSAADGESPSKSSDKKRPLDDAESNKEGPDEPLPTLPLKKARTAYFIFADAKREGLKELVSLTSLYSDC